MRNYKCRLTGLTLSEEQFAFASERLRQEIAEGKAEIRLQDYRDTGGVFDRIVSIEMFEAVGEAYWPTYFDTLKRRLAEGGTAVLQVITIAEERFDNYRRPPDFIQRYIFPGGMLPTKTHMHELAETAGLRVTAQLSFGEGYSKTLSEWRRRFRAAWPQSGATRLRRPVPPHVGLLPRLLRCRVSSRRHGRDPVPDAEVLAAVHTPIGICSAERVTARGAVSSFHADSALWTAANGLRLTNLPRPGCGCEFCPCCQTTSPRDSV